MRHRLAPSLLAFVALVPLAEGRARAARPTTADCLAASDASLEAGNQHKLRAERADLLVCAASSCPADIRKECARRVEEVNGHLPTVIFEAKDAAGNDVSAVRVTMDGDLLAERLDGTALPVDPGEHTFLFQTEGEKAITKKLVVRQGQKDRREAVAFPAPATVVTAPPPARAAIAAPPPAASFVPLAPAPSPQPLASDGGDGLGAQKVLALVAGGIGIAGLGVGAAFGVMAISKKNDAQSVCPTQCSSTDGVTAWSDAASAGNISTVALIAGAAALVGAGTLWWSAPSSTHGPSTRIGVGPGGLQIKGSW